MSYSKCKDAPPEKTIAIAEEALRSIGVYPQIEIVKRIDGVYSAVLKDETSKWITCGKGTSEEYCIASAYGEAIEHLCNYTAYDMNRLSEKAEKSLDFSLYPDEVYVKISDVLRMLPQLYSDLQKSYSLGTGRIATYDTIVSLLKDMFHSEEIPCIPFYSVKSRREILIPNIIISNLCGSNGGGAGNTSEEALGHALDEIAERFAKERIYHQRLTPPTVPREFIEKRAPELLNIIQNIENKESFKVVVKDASLGCGLPVICVLLVDYKRQRYMVNFGAHLNFPLALERCLTEMFQFYETDDSEIRRKKMVHWSATCDEVLNGIANWVSLLKDDVGYIPDSFFAGKPSWEFVEWPVLHNYTNASGLKKQLETLLKLSGDIYIRNNSYFSFYAYKVYIPGISTVKLPFDEKQLNSYRICSSMSELLDNKKTRSSKELELLSSSVFSPNILATGLAFHNLDEDARYILYAALLKDLGEIKKACSILKMFDRKIYQCAAHAMELICSGKAKRDVQEMICLFYGKEESDFAIRWLESNSFDQLVGMYLRVHKKDSEKKSVLRDALSPLDALHIRLKQHMASHPIMQISTDDVIYPDRGC